MKYLACLLAAASAGPALAVGLGPLAKSGITDGPAKAFYLTVINPYPAAESYRSYAVATTSDEPVDRVRIVPAVVRVGARKNRRILVIAQDLKPGETLSFRVCAERQKVIEGTIHARVCSRLTARRLPAGA